MKFLSIFIFVFTLLTNFCIAQVIRTEKSNVDHILLQDYNSSEDFESTEGSGIRLFKIPNGCRIIHNIYGETGQTEYIFEFKKNNITKSEFTEFRYDMKKEGVTETLLNLQDEDIHVNKKGTATRKEFYEVKKLLNQKTIKDHCY